MTDRRIENKLTPAAKSALNEFVENYKEQILVGAINSASELTGETREITVKDIISGIENSKAQMDRKTAVRLKLLRVMMITGFLYAIIGIAYFIYSNFELKLTSQMGLILTFTGLIISLFSYFLLNFVKEKYRLTIGSEGTIGTGYLGKSMELLVIKKWSEIELSARDLLASRMGESRADMPINHIIEFLTKKGIFNEREYNLARRLLEMRNQILHRGKTFSKKDINGANNIADKLLHLIRSNSIDNGT